MLFVSLLAMVLALGGGVYCLIVGDKHRWYGLVPIATYLLSGASIVVLGETLGGLASVIIVGAAAALGAWTTRLAYEDRLVRIVRDLDRQ